MKLNVLTLSIVAATAAFSMSSQSFAASEYSKAKDVLQGDKKAWLAKCDIKTGADKSLCKVEAKGAYDIALAELKVKYEPSAKHSESLRVTRAEVEYDIAKEKCGQLSGNQKDVCMKDAKTALVAAKANAKTARVSSEAKANAAEKVAEVRADGAKDTNDAAYAAAKERCDTYSGDAKDRCVAEVKARFGKG